jgi:hypothetical protein
LKLSSVGTVGLILLTPAAFMIHDKPYLIFHGGSVMELVSLGPEFGVEVRGAGLIDVASSDSTYHSIRAALEEHSLLLFREQEVTATILRQTAHWCRRPISEH